MEVVLIPMRGDNDDGILMKYIVCILKKYIQTEGKIGPLNV